MERVLAVLVAALLVVVPPAAAQLSCVTQNTACSGGVELFRMDGSSGDTNAHAELPGQSYTWRVCCSGVANLGTSCSGAEGTDFDYALFLSSTTNAHAEFASTLSAASTPYSSNPVCLSVSSGGTGANCQLEAGSCSAGTCVTTLSGSTNAHVASCTSQNAYTNLVCCSAGSDVTPPNLIFISPTPADGSIVSTNIVPINITASPAEVLNSCIVQVDDGSTKVNHTMTIISGGAACYYDAGAFVDGDYVFEGFARDVSGNEGVTAKRTIKVRADLPTSTISQPTQGSVFRSSNWGSLTGTATDGNDGVKAVSLSVTRTDNTCWDGSSWTTCPVWFFASMTPSTGGPGETVSWTYSLPVADGNFVLQSLAQDNKNFGQSPPTVVSFGIDGQAPTASLTNLQNGAITGNALFTYTGTASDPQVNSYASGIAEVQYQVEHEMTPGTSIWETTVAWPGTAMVYDQPLPAQTTTFNVGIPLRSGLNRISVMAVDDAGNAQSPLVQDIVLYDTTFPSVSIDGPAAGPPYTEIAWNNTNPVRGQATPGAAGIDTVDVFVERAADGLYWDGNAWVAAETWLSADTSGLPNWRWPATGKYLPDAAGIYHIRANATDTIGRSTIDDVVVTLDNAPPDAWIYPPMPAWTTNSTLLVSWDGSDNHGIASFAIQYEDQTAGGGFVQLLPPVPDPGTAALPNVQNNHAYRFSVTATDTAGNTFTNYTTPVQVDLKAPVCAVTPFNPYGGSPLTVNWGIVEGESGVSKLDVYVRQAGLDWVNVNSTSSPCAPVQPSDTSTTCAGLADGLAEFMCGAEDVAGNQGANSSVEGVTVDTTTPNKGIIVQPNTVWLNRMLFTLKWIVSDSGGASGIASTNVQWSNDTGTNWWNITQGGNAELSPGLTSIQFGSGVNGDPPTAEIYDGEIFWFRARGTDSAGNVGGWTAPPSQTGIDTTLPNGTVNATDPSGVLVDSSTFKNAGTVTVNALAWDRPPPLGISGLLSTSIWTQLTQEGVALQEYVCPDPAGCSTPPISTAGLNEFVFWVETTDNAGNSYISPSVTLADHALANFVVHDVLLTMGTSAMLEVQVRNLNSIPFSYTELNLSQYTAAGFVGGSGDFSGFVIAQDGRSVAITNLQAGGRGTFYVLIAATDPEKSGQLALTAYGEGGTVTASDTDSAHIDIVFPASFSGLTDWALLLLMGLAVLLFAKRR